MPDDEQLSYGGIPIVWDKDMPKDSYYLLPPELPAKIAEAQERLGRPIKNIELMALWFGHGDVQQVIEDAGK